MGGISGSFTTLSSVELFDGTSWSAGPDLTTARSDFGLAMALQNLLLVSHHGVGNAGQQGLRIGAHELDAEALV